MVNFSSRFPIYDPHIHFAPKGFETKFNGDDLGTENVINCINSVERDSQGKYNIERAMIINIKPIDTVGHVPGDYPMQTQAEGFYDTMQECKKDPRFLPTLVCQPGYATAQEAQQLVQQSFVIGNPVRALKFHPYTLGINANHHLYDPFIAIAQKYKLPCVFHTAPGTSEPDLVYKLMKRFPNTPCVLYHSKYGGPYEDAIKVVQEAKEKKDANLYLELSWVDMGVKSNVITDAIKAVGPDRVIFGSDAPLDVLGQKDTNGRFIGGPFYVKRIEDIKRKITQEFGEEKSPEIIKKIFYTNSKNLFERGSYFK